MSRIILLVFLFLYSGSVLIAQDATTLYNEGLSLKKAKKTREALEKFDQVTILNPGNIDALFEKGWCQNELNDYSNSILTFRKVRSKWADVPKVYFELGYAFEKMKNMDSAMACYTRCLELNPNYTSVFKRLGNMAFDQSNYDKALVHYKKYIEVNTTEINDYLFWYRKGYAENSVKSYADAKSSLQRSLNYKTDFTKTYLELGYASFKLKQAEEAILFYKKALVIEPQNHIPYNGIAEVYRDINKDYTEAKTWYQKTMAINPKERKANFGIAYCLNSETRYAEAIPYLQTAIKSEPEYNAAIVELGYSYFKTGNSSEALSQFKKAIALQPANENARYYSALLYISLKDKSNAQKMVDELRELNSKHSTDLQDKINNL